MKHGPPMLLACAALLLGAGCGSSSRSTTSSASGASPPTTSTHQGGFKVSTTPKFGSAPKSAPVQSGTVKIAYRNITIAPDTVKVKVGSTIVWTNEDPVEHNVTSHSGPAHFASKNFGEGQSFSVTVTRPGVIHYLCTIHPTTMNGTIEVGS
jgi:plastocyanin